jgi:hypothetical protein
VDKQRDDICMLINTLTGRPQQLAMKREGNNTEIIKLEHMN